MTVLRGQVENQKLCLGANTKQTRPESCLELLEKQDFRQYSSSIKCVEPKFMKVPGSDGMRLSDFEAEVQRHLEDHGMDSIFWKIITLKELHNTIQSRSIFSIQSEFDSLQYMEIIYDNYDKDNLIDPRLLLLASIDNDNDIKSNVNTYLKSKATGPEIWIRMIHEAQSSSVS